MNPTKIKRKELKRGDMFCEITAMADRPVMIAFKDGDDPFFDQSVFEREVHRIDMPDYTHELTRFSWKLKDLDDKVEAIITRNKHNGALVETMSKQDAHIEGLKTKIDAHDEEPTIRLNECRHAKQTLQGIIDTLESDVEKLRMKIFDIEGREDLVTTELEKENCNLKEDVMGKSEIIRRWKNNWCPAKCAEKQKTIDELISDKTILQDTIQKMIVAECGDQTRAVEIIASKSAKIEMLSTKLFMLRYQT
jgi:hypothetical protein